MSAAPASKRLKSSVDGSPPSGLSMFSLEGKVAVITGGYGVLGSSWSKGLARCGARVAVLGRRPEAAASLVDEITSAGGEAMFLRADVLDKDSLDAACAELIKTWEVGGTPTRPSRTPSVPPPLVPHSRTRTRRFLCSH